MSNLLSRAADAAACQMLNDIGSAGTQIAMWTMWTGKASLVPLGVGALSYMANNLLCDETDGPPGSTDPELTGCIKGAPGVGYSIGHISKAGEERSCSGTIANEITGLGVMREFNGYWGRQVFFKWASDGRPGTYNACVARTREEAEGARYFLNVPENECQSESDPSDPGNPRPITDPYNYTDPETNCNYTLKLEGFVQQYEGGPAEPVWQIESSGTRADGGRIGGCNLAPTIYLGGNGDNGGGDGGGSGGRRPQLPVPDGGGGDGPDGEPWWLKPLIGAAAGALLNQILDALKNERPPNYTDGSFVFTAPCDKDEQGNALTRTWEFPQTSFYQRVIDHQVAILQVLQQHMDWKTPICLPEATPLEGEWITTRWQSDEVMDHSGRRLRKLFRYRSKSSRELQQLSSYWESFVWRSGPVCVKHKGAWWGYPQVWAESIEEGKRVIRFAGAEAGIDPDQVGRWEIGGSRTPRYGMPGTMRILRHKGFPWVASRDGADWPNVLAKEA